MTALAAAYAHAQGAGAKPIYRLKQNGKLAISKKLATPKPLPYDLASLAEQCDHDNSLRHNRDLGLKDPMVRAPRPGFKFAPILSTSRLCRPGKGDHTQAFAITHACDKVAHAAIQPIATTNFVPERPRVSKALLVRKMMKGKKS